MDPKISSYYDRLEKFLSNELILATRPYHLPLIEKISKTMNESTDMDPLTILIASDNDTSYINYLVNHKQEADNYVYLESIKYYLLDHHYENLFIMFDKEFNFEYDIYDFIRAIGNLKLMEYLYEKNPSFNEDLRWTESQIQNRINDIDEDKRKDAIIAVAQFLPSLPEGKLKLVKFIGSFLEQYGRKINLEIIKYLSPSILSSVVTLLSNDIETQGYSRSLNERGIHLVDNIIDVAGEMIRRITSNEITSSLDEEYRLRSFLNLLIENNYINHPQLIIELIMRVYDSYNVNKNLLLQKENHQLLSEFIDDVSKIMKGDLRDDDILQEKKGREITDMSSIIQILEHRKMIELEQKLITSEDYQEGSKKFMPTITNYNDDKLFVRENALTEETHKNLLLSDRTINNVINKLNTAFTINLSQITKVEDPDTKIIIVLKGGYQFLYQNKIIQLNEKSLLWLKEPIDLDLQEIRDKSSLICLK